MTSAAISDLLIDRNTGGTSGTGCCLLYCSAHYDRKFLAALSSSRSIVVCPSVGPSVRRSVRRSVGRSAGPSVRSDFSFQANLQAVLECNQTGWLHPKIH